MPGNSLFKAAAASTLSVTLACLLSGCAPGSAVQATASRPQAAGPFATIAQIAEVDARFQSYNVEMVEVTGGRFWAPYGGPADEVYRMRGPADLTDTKLRALARALGPVYMRVSGTWANSTYIPAEGETLAEPPEGFNQVLTREQWRGVVDFSRAVEAQIVTSFPVSPGARDAEGVWRTQQAQRLLDLTREAGGQIAAAEFYNEPNASMVGGLPKGYDASDYARDFAIFDKWVRKAAPQMIVLGPGSVGEGALASAPVNGVSGLIRSQDMLAANPGRLDAVSYHFYGEVSQRCGARRGTSAQKAEALSPEWLDLTLREHDYYAGLRDRFEPGDPMWVTETAQAACGGSPWAASFLDSFRYVNQLGLLAQKGVKVVMHNTLAASDYALIDGDTLVPRPNYWVAVLWRRVMGTGVLAPPETSAEDLRLYAHCLAGAPGGVGLVAINLGDEARTVPTGTPTQVWTLQAASLDSGAVTVNGHSPGLAEDGTLTGLNPISSGDTIAVPGKTIVFAALPEAGNSACLKGPA
ncbi:hypothetical protein I5E68_13785 [Novosphingobium sp. YJ-S2-02]|uniref:Glycosyl hydrolase family 79 n=1 Tax=Novosphingobium aureum TaxID=2792964 RepID=A0A931HEQ5_9SPHN|nr:hypothetical protein [Novosphingobium aureum]MBH0114014.1 hypothetical protein [Novosphingobium aureum]